MTNWGLCARAHSKENEYRPFTITVVIVIVIDTAATTMVTFSLIIYGLPPLPPTSSIGHSSLVARQDGERRTVFFTNLFYSTSLPYPL